MINELKKLSDSMRDAGLSGEEWDDKFKEIKIKGAPCFIVLLSDLGEIADIRYIDSNRAKVLRTWLGGSNGECFPCFNFQPFYELVEEQGNSLSSHQKSMDIKTFISAFKGASEPPLNVGSISMGPRDKADKKTAKCLGNIANSFFAIVADDQKIDDSFVRLRTAVSKLVAGTGAESFNHKMLEFLRNHITEDLALIKNVPTIWSILFKKSPDVVLFFDLSVTTSFPIASEKGMQIINSKLLARRESSASALEGSLKDAFGKMTTTKELSEKLPEVKLPGVIANTKLRSMSSESKCQTRYRFIDAESFPIGDEIRKSAKSALAWIASPEREGKTWAIAGANELVFAYPKTMPKSAPLLARLFGNGRTLLEDATVIEERFEKYAIDALSSIKSLSQGTALNTEIEVFAIKKADKARRKVVFYRNYSLRTLEAAVNEWLVGAQNIPKIQFRKWPRKKKGEKSEKGTKPVLAELCTPLPLGTIDLVYEVWAQDGNEKAEPKYRSAPLYEGLPVFDGLELFLGASAVMGLAKRLLGLLLQNSAGLYAATGNISHRHIDNVIANAKVVAYLEKSLPLFGILLYKLNRTKENYMANAPYLIGRFLNLSDGLHTIWCRNVKEKDPLPPQLIGSSFFASFQINPVQAFAAMALRVKPYLDWAKTNQTKDVALSHWYVGEMGRIATAINECGIPVSLSDLDKAEMLLGYLASTNKSSVDEAESSNSDDTKTKNS